MVSLYKSDSFSCGGVLISSHWIATAAHCVYESEDDESGDAIAYDASYFNVTIGESTHYLTTSSASASDVTVRAIKNVIINPNYTSNTGDGYDYDYDIALLELETPYYKVGPAIATETRFDELSDDDYLTLIGFGNMSTDNDATYDEIIPTTLQEAQLPFVPTSECYWNDYGLVSDNMFCAGYSDGTNINACSGDSGGPIFTVIDGELTLVGLVSWGTSTCSTVPNVFTNVSALRDWILANIDGYQVVEEGDASYNSEEGSYSDGLISVYHYGNSDGDNSDVDDELVIGDLAFSADYADTLTLSDSCSNDTLSYSSDGSCTIGFSLISEISEDTEFSATLSITPSESAGKQTYNLKFIADTDAIADDTDSDADTDTDTDTDDDNADTISTGGGSFGFIFLLLVAVLGGVRLNYKQ